MNTGLSRGWSAWHAAYVHQVRQLTLMKRAGLSLLRPKLMHAYRSWYSDWRKAAFQQEEQMRRQLAEELALERERRVEHLQQLGLKRLRNMSLARGWSAWHDKWTEHAHKLRLMKNASSMLLKPKLVAAYGSWRREWESEMLLLRSMTDAQKLAAELAKSSELEEKLSAVMQQLELANAEIQACHASPVVCVRCL